MPDIEGKDVLIYIGDGADPEVFTKIGSSQSDELTINNQAVDINTKDSDGWVERFAPGVTKSVNMSMRGVWRETADHDQLLNLAADGAPSANFLFLLGGARRFRGAFLVDSFTYSGETEGPAQFSAQFSSDGAIVIELVP